MAIQFCISQRSSWEREKEWEMGEVRGWSLSRLCKSFSSARQKANSVELGYRSLCLSFCRRSCCEHIQIGSKIWLRFSCHLREKEKERSNNFVPAASNLLPWLRKQASKRKSEQELELARVSAHFRFITFCPFISYSFTFHTLSLNMWIFCEIFREDSRNQVNRATG